MFKDCILLKSIPDLYNWDFENINNCNNMFEGCKLLSSIPDFKVKRSKTVIQDNDFLKISNKTEIFPKKKGIFSSLLKK